MTFTTTPNAEVCGLIMWIRQIWRTHVWISICMWISLYMCNNCCNDIYNDPKCRNMWISHVVCQMCITRIWISTYMWIRIYMLISHM